MLRFRNTAFWWQYSHDTFPLIKAVAEEDDEEIVGDDWMKNISIFWGWHSHDTFPLIKAAAEEDDEEIVGWRTSLVFEDDILMTRSL